VYFLLDLVDELDLSAILIPAMSKDPRGEKGFDPRMMTLLLLYAQGPLVVCPSSAGEAPQAPFWCAGLAPVRWPRRSRIPLLQPI